jgi:hypothetical protein
LLLELLLETLLFFGDPRCLLYLVLEGHFVHWIVLAPTLFPVPAGLASDKKQTLILRYLRNSDVQFVALIAKLTLSFDIHPADLRGEVSSFTWIFDSNTGSIWLFLLLTLFAVVVIFTTLVPVIVLVVVVLLLVFRFLLWHSW